MSQSKHKVDCSIFFPDNHGDKRFLFRLINFGKETDELKFIFIPKGTGFTYFETEDTFTELDIFGLYSEITYHNDGSLLYKFPGNRRGDKIQYKNPAGIGKRRTPILQLREWEPFIRYTIVDYSLCKVIDTENAISPPYNPVIFGGDPFVCTLFLGHMAYKEPMNNQPIEIIYRINDIADKVDLILWFYKTDYRGRAMRVDKSDLVIHSRSNLIQVVDKKIRFRDLDKDV